MEGARADASLYPSLPFRLLLDVPYVGHFLSTWTLVEPTEIDLSILTPGRSRKRNAGVNAILQVSCRRSHPC